MSILRFLGLSNDTTPQPGDTSEAESIRNISRKLEQMDPRQARYLAAFAYLLGRVAHADREISQDEADEMERIVMKKGHLPKEQAVMIVEMAKRQNRLFGHVENFLVTREFNELANREQKLELLDCLFAISSSDKSVSSVEDTEIRQIASELLLDHREFIQVRSRYRDYLDILKTQSED